MKKHTTLFILIAAVLIIGMTGCSTEYSDKSQVTDGYGTDIVRTDEHEDITWDLITMIEHQPDLKHLLEQSISQAYEINPDPDTNPVHDLESYYDFIDFCS